MMSAVIARRHGRRSNPDIIAGLPRAARNAALAMTKGYTLIELLIVIFIISIVTTVALISISNNKNKRIESFANQITQVLSLAEEQAMLQPAVLRVQISDQALQFASLQQAEKSQKNTWIPLQDNILGKQAIPSGIQVSVKVDSQVAEDDKQDPQIIISSNGEATPFTIYVGKPGEKPLFAIRGEMDGSITNKSLS